MKIFHTKNGTEIVFIQKQDIVYLLNESGISIPSLIIEAFTAKVSNVTASTKSDFVEFDDQQIVEFLKNTEFIIDYNEYKDFSTADLMSVTIELQTDAKEICDKYNAMSESEKQENTVKSHHDHDNIIYMTDAISDIYSHKMGIKDIKIPDFV